MRYLVIDAEGNQRGSFDSVEDLVDELNEGAEEDAASIRAMHVVAYQDGSPVGPSTPAEQVLRGFKREMSVADGAHAFVLDFMRHVVRVGGFEPPVGQVAPLQPAGSAR